MARVVCKEGDKDGKRDSTAHKVETGSGYKGRFISLETKSEKEDSQHGDGCTKGPEGGMDKEEGAMIIMMLMMMMVGVWDR